MQASTSNANTNNIFWEWLEDGPMWVPYDGNISNQMEQSFTSGQAHCSFAVATGGRHGTGAQYDVDLNSMIQVNQGTGFTRRVRRFEAQSSVQWDWESDQGWAPFSPESSAQLEGARSSGRAHTTLHLMVGGWNVTSYTIDLQANTQTNTHTGMQRRIRRGTSSGPSNQGGGSTSQSQLTDADIQQIIDSATVIQDNLDDDDEVVCPVCLDNFFDEDEKQALQLAECEPGHYFHAACVELFLRNKPQCPCCFKFYAMATGTQPNGTMNITVHPSMSIPGETSAGAIEISYSFPNGIQGPEHPNPGHQYYGTSRRAYLPNTTKGQEVLALLQQSFDQRLTFTIGTSITTGRDNCVVWNGIHHKTSLSGGPTNFGYPDPGYLDRVKEELSAKGIS